MRRVCIIGLTTIIVISIVLLALHMLIPPAPEKNKVRRRGNPPPPPRSIHPQSIISLTNSNISTELWSLSKKWHKEVWLKSPLIIDTHKITLMPWYIEHDFCATEHYLGDVSYYITTDGKTKIVHSMMIHYLTKQGQEVTIHQRTLSPDEISRSGLDTVDDYGTLEKELNLNHWAGKFDALSFGKIEYVIFKVKRSDEYDAHATFKYKGRMVSVHCYGFKWFMPRQAAEIYLRNVVDSLVVLQF